MWIFKDKYDALNADLAIEMAKVASLASEVKLLRERLEDYKQRAESSDRERIEMREELLIASGVKRSKFDEQLLERQLSEAKDEGASYNQTRQWALNNETKSLMLSEQEKQERAKQLMADLEREFEASRDEIN